VTDTFRGLLGIAVILLLAFAFSENRRGISWRPVIGGVVLQFALAVLLIDFPPATKVFFLLNDGADALQRATDAGTGFVFGFLAGPPYPFTVTNPAATFVLALKALPLVLVISALSSLLFYWGVLQAVMRGFAWLLRRALGLGGALSLGAAVHVFVGMIEAPLLIRPWLIRMERGEIFALMTCGMAGVAGTVMVIYAGILNPIVPNALGNILIASVISTPAALAVAALMVPYGPGEAGAGNIAAPHRAVGSVDALVKGIADGVGPLVGILSVLIVAVTLVTLVNMALGLLPDWDGAAITLQRVAALPLRPLLWLIGVSWAESAVASTLMGTKTVLNEFVAYLDLARLPPEALSPRARLIMTYALCGFANFGSLGILVGGMGAMVPERRAEIVSLGFRSLVSGTLATCGSGAVAGLLG
jgi:CNT family concentrative nucleoside transporter